MISDLRFCKQMDAPAADLHEYQRLIGKILFLKVTQLDLTYAVGMLSRFSSAPQAPHMAAAKHVLRYLRGSSDLGLVYCRGEDSVLLGFCDADWAGDLEDQK